MHYEKVFVSDDMVGASPAETVLAEITGTGVVKDGRVLILPEPETGFEVSGFLRFYADGVLLHADQPLANFAAVADGDMFALGARVSKFGGATNSIIVRIPQGVSFVTSFKIAALATFDSVGSFIADVLVERPV